MTSPTKAGVPMPHASLARTTATVAMTTHGARFVAALAGLERGSYWVATGGDIATSLVALLAMGSTASCVASYCESVSAPNDASTARRLGAFYVVLGVMGVLVTASLLLHGIPSIPVTITRAAASLGFAGLAIAGFIFASRLRRL